MWLEDVAGRPAASWSLADYAVAIERLGRAQGRAAAVATSLPMPEWVSRGFLRQHLDRQEGRFDGSLLEDPAAWERAESAGFTAPGLRSAAVRLRDARFELLALVEAAPQTIAHLDVWPNNLYAETDVTVLIDWAFAGVGALGEDPGNLVPDAIFDLIHPSSLMAELDVAVSEAYAAGLRAGGWDGDLGAARRAMRASAAKYSWIAPAALAEASEPVQLGYGGRPIADRRHWLAERAAVVAHLGGWATEALAPRD
jgi:hypothetical protein